MLDETTWRPMLGFPEANLWNKLNKQESSKPNPREPAETHLKHKAKKQVWPMQLDASSQKQVQVGATWCIL